MRVLIGMFFSAVLLNTFACSATNNRSASVSNHNANIDTSFTSPEFQATSRSIKAQRPEIPDEILIRDGLVLREALPEITDYYQQRGFTKEQAEEAMLLNWQDRRLHQPTASLSQQDFKTSAKDYGFLVVKSSPTGASVIIGDKKLDDPTDTESFLRPGNYRVQLSKADYESVTGTCQIKAGEKTEFTRQLPPKNP